MITHSLSDLQCSSFMALEDVFLVLKISIFSAHGHSLLILFVLLMLILLFSLLLFCNVLIGRGARVMSVKWQNRLPVFPHG